jgi:hypothetical protein
VRQIEIDDIGLQPLQRRIDGLFDIGGGEVFPALPHVRPDLGDHHDLVAIAAAFHPFADDRFGFAALVAGNPARIGIGGVDGVEAGADEPVEQVERGFLVGGPAEDVATQNKRRDGQVGLTETTFLQD